MRNIRYGTVCRLQAFPGYLENLVDPATGLPIPIATGLSIYALIRRMSDGKVYRFDTSSWENWSNITAGLESNTWQLLTEIMTVDTGLPVVYEYNWTFPENVTSTETPEQYQIHYYEAVHGIFKKEDIQYLPTSVTFDFWSVSPLEVAQITVLGS